jgi:hypothetical protein
MFVRMCLLCWWPNWIRSFLRTRLLWLPPRVAFVLTSETHVVIARLCLLLPTPLALSPQKVTPVPTTTLALSPQKVTCSISLLISPRQPTPFSSTSYARSKDRAFSPQKADVAACSRPAGRVRDGERGQWTSTSVSSKQTPLCPLPLWLGAVLCAVTTTATPPSILLLGCALLIESPRQGGN